MMDNNILRWYPVEYVKIFTNKNARWKNVITSSIFLFNGHCWHLYGKQDIKCTLFYLCKFEGIFKFWPLRGWQGIFGQTFFLTFWGFKLIWRTQTEEHLKFWPFLGGEGVKGSILWSNIFFFFFDDLKKCAGTFWVFTTFDHLWEGGVGGEQVNFWSNIAFKITWQNTQVEPLVFN